MVPRVTHEHVEPEINELHICLATGNQSTAYQSIGTHNKIDDLKHQGNGLLAYYYFSTMEYLTDLQGTMLLLTADHLDSIGVEDIVLFYMVVQMERWKPSPGRK